MNGSWWIDQNTQTLYISVAVNSSGGSSFFLSCFVMEQEKQVSKEKLNFLFSVSMNDSSIWNSDPTNHTNKQMKNHQEFRVIIFACFLLSIWFPNKYHLFRLNSKPLLLIYIHNNNEDCIHRNEFSSYSILSVCLFVCKNP